MQIQSQDKNQQQSQPICDTRSAWQAFSAGQHLLLSHFPYSHYWLTAFPPPPPLLIISVSAKRHFSCWISQVFKVYYLSLFTRLLANVYTYYFVIFYYRPIATSHNLSIYIYISNMTVFSFFALSVVRQCNAVFACLFVHFGPSIFAVSILVSSVSVIM